jgi:HlyD family secretion protein
MRVNEINPMIPDPVAGRRSTSGAALRFAYGAGIIALGLYLAWYFGRGFLFLEGTGVVSAPLHVVSTPYLSKIDHINVAPGISVYEGDILATVRSPQLEQDINALDRILVDQSHKEADLRIRYRIAKATSETADARMAVANEAYARLEAGGSAAASLTYRMDVSRERSQAHMQKVQAQAEAEEIQAQLDLFAVNRRFVKAKIDRLREDFDEGYVRSPVDGLIGNRVARDGEIIRPGDTIAEVYDTSDIYVVWHVPSFNIRQPKVADPVYIHHGQRVIQGYVFEIKQIAEAAPEAVQSVLRGSTQHQVILVRARFGRMGLPLNAPVIVRMNYSFWLDTAVQRVFEFLP